MRRIMTALIFSVLAVFCAVSSEAAYTTKLTLIISRPSAPKVSEDKISSDGTFHGTVDLSEVYTDSHGRRTSETHTLFTNRAGIIMMSADVRITLNSDDYKALSGEKFAETVSVDSVIELYDSDYDSYTYSLDVKGLPEWLKVSGETSYDDAISVGVSEYHHEFVIAGTPDREYDAANIIFTALIFVSGDYPAMLAKGSMDVSISAGTIPKPPDGEPKSPDVEPKPDGEPKSPDVEPKPDGEPKSPDVEPKPDGEPKSPDVEPKPDGGTKSPDVEPKPDGGTKSPDVEPKPDGEPKSPDIEPKPDDEPKSPDVEPASDDKTPETIDIGGNDTGTEPKTLAEALKDMTQEQKEAVKVLKIGANITSLEGLEEFTNLEELDLENAKNLESVNLMGNSSIKSVYIADNTNLKSLTLTGSGVEVLDASNCESLTELNIAGCESLVYLDVSSTSITTLNADGCTNLAMLNCSNCGIEDLSLTGCDSLNILDCSNNNLHRLDAYLLGQLSVLKCENQVVYGPAMGRVLDILQYFDGISASANGDYTSGSGIESGIKNVINLRAFDSSGREISSEYDKETGIASFSEEPAKVTYDYITGFENVNMDVTIYPAYESGGKKESRQPGNPGGCNAISILPLFAAMIILVTGIRRHFYRRI